MGARVEHAGFQELADSAQTVVYLGHGAMVLGAGDIGRIVMMAGDLRPVALRIGAELGLARDEAHAEMLPQDKVREVEGLARHGKVAFVGDGVNDAAALRSPTTARAPSSEP